ncbi:signal peptidase II [Candidatus Falkowbacteria bacterium]|nr:signal peptidase II [Candidatus Falkowbacteria bacterium]
MEKSKTKILLPYLVILILFIVDRILKYTAVSLDKTSGFFVFEKNTGIAFSIHLPQIILPILTFIIILFVISYSLKYLASKKFTLHLTTLLVITGAISNLIDRLKFGYVIDYINLKFWPVFNVADVMIVVGVIIWMWNLRSQKLETRNNV